MWKCSEHRLYQVLLSIRRRIENNNKKQKTNKSTARTLSLALLSPLFFNSLRPHKRGPMCHPRSRSYLVSRSLIAQFVENVE